jgi:hypothetical protein
MAMMMFDLHKESPLQSQRFVILDPTGMCHSPGIVPYQARQAMMQARLDPPHLPPRWGSCMYVIWHIVLM